jgi:hypothetical protein
MLNSQIVQLLSGISSVLGLLAVLAYLYTVAQGRRAERSVRQIIQGEPLFNANQIVHILKLFKDDASRLEALSRLADNDRDHAARVLRKIKNNVDIGKLQAQSDRHRLAGSGIGGAVLLLFGVIGLVSANRAPSPPASTVPFRIVSPEAGATVELGAAVSFTSPFADLDYYITVVPLRAPDRYVVDGPLHISEDRLASGHARFGNEAAGKGERFAIQIIATKAKLAEGVLAQLPADAKLSSQVVVYRAK